MQAHPLPTASPETAIPAHRELGPAHDPAAGDRRQPRHPPARRGLAHHASGSRRGRARLGRRSPLRPGRRRGLRHRHRGGGAVTLRFGVRTPERPLRLPVLRDARAPLCRVLRDHRHRAGYADGRRRGSARRAARDDRLPRGPARRRASRGVRPVLRRGRTSGSRRSSTSPTRSCPHSFRSTSSSPSP